MMTMMTMMTRYAGGNGLAMESAEWYTMWQAWDAMLAVAQGVFIRKKVGAQN